MTPCLRESNYAAVKRAKNENSAGEPKMDLPIVARNQRFMSYNYASMQTHLNN